MKILVVSHTYIVKLNCAKLELLANLEDNHQVMVVVPKLWQPGGVQNKTVTTTPRSQGNFSLIPLSNFSKNNQALLTFGLEIKNLLQEFQPDIIQVEQGAKSLGYAQLITLNRWLNLKAKNVFFTWWNLPYQTKFPLSWLESYNLRHTQGLIGGNQDAVDILQNHGYRGKSTVLPQLGVDEQLFTPKPQIKLAEELGIKSTEFVIGFVGRFVEEKGILTLVKAVAKLQLSNWRLLLLGRGDLITQIRTEATELGIIDKLIVVETVPHEQVANYLNLMNVLVLPSQTTYKVKTISAVGWKEQFGHVLIEAMACKIPVIGSNSGEIPHVIEDAGLIFPEGDAIALSKCLQQLADNTDLANHLAELGYQRVRDKYTNLALAKQQLEFYQELLNN